MAGINSRFLFGGNVEAILDLIDESDFEKELKKLDCQITDDLSIIFS